MGHRGSWLGFTFNGIHSSTLGITRITDKRVTDKLTPTTKDTTVNVEGVDGVLYWGSKYTKRDFSVSFAFQSMDKTQLTRLRRFLQATEICDLIFDETPYKVYSAKITGQAMIKHLAFGDNAQEYYNGEGSITFTCYFPFARSRYAWQENYTIDNIPEWMSDEDWMSTAPTAQKGTVFYDFDVPQDNPGIVEGDTASFSWVAPNPLLIPYTDTTEWDDTMNGKLIMPSYQDSPYVNYNDWIAASRIPSRENYGVYDPSTHTMRIYNAGDIAMPTRIWFDTYFASVQEPFSVEVSCAGQSMSLQGLVRSQAISPLGAGGDYYTVIDMVNQRVEGYDNNNRHTGRIYDRYMTGSFFQIPQGESTLYISQTPIRIDFNYLYL